MGILIQGIHCNSFELLSKHEIEVKLRGSWLYLVMQRRIHIQVPCLSLKRLTHFFISNHYHHDTLHPLFNAVLLPLFFIRAIVYVKSSLKLVQGSLPLVELKQRQEKVAKGVIFLSVFSITNNLLCIKSLLEGLIMLFKPSNFQKTSPSTLSTPNKSGIVKKKQI